MTSLSLNETNITPETKAAPINFLDQLARIREHKSAFLLCVVLAFFVAAPGYYAAHYAVPEAHGAGSLLWTIVYSAVSLFCTGFSLISVFKVGMLIHRNRALAFCYASGMELGLIVIQNNFLNRAILGVVVFISAVNYLFSMLRAKEDADNIKKSMRRAQSKGKAKPVVKRVRKAKANNTAPEISENVLTSELIPITV